MSERNSDGNNNDKIKNGNVIDTPGLILGDIVFEQIEGGYAVKFRKNSIQVFGGEIELQGKRYKPLEKCPWPLASEPIESDLNSLYQEIRQFLYDRLDLIDDRLYDILVCWILATWRHEDFDTAPFIFFLGPKESGKSRGLELLESLSYRGIQTVNITPASLFRLTQLYNPTYLIDESEIIAQNQELKALLNSRYRRGCTVTRQRKDGKGNFEPEFFNVFGFTALAGTNSFHDTLESRCITIYMEKSTRRLKRFRLNCEETKQLRSKLLSYRLKNCGLAFSNIDLTDFTNDRLAELFHPLLVVAPPTNVRILREYAKDLMAEREEAEESSTEAQIMNAVLSSHGKITNGKLATKDITNKLNEDIVNNRFQWTSNSVGWKLKRLGFKHTRMSDKTGSRGIRWDYQRLLRLSKRYNLVKDFPEIFQNKLDVLNICNKTSEMTETSEPHITNDPKPDISDISDRFRKHNGIPPIEPRPTGTPPPAPNLNGLGKQSDSNKS